MPLITDSVFRLQNRIAETVAHSLGTEFILEEGKSIDSRHRVPIEAQRLAMRGRGELNNFFDGLGRHHADSAMKFFDQTLAIDPEYALAVACKGEVFMHRDRNFDSAIYYCMKAIQLDQEEGFSYWILGECYKKMELFDLSIENYLKAYEVYPYVPGPNMNLGYLYITKKQDVINGLPYLKLSLEQRPLDELNQLVASECYSYMGDYEKAKEHALKSFNLGHKYTSWGIQCYHGALVAMNKFSEDLQFLDSICNIKDCEDNLFNIYWALHLNMEDFEMAENRYEKLIKKGGRLELYDSIFLAYMYQQLGQEENYRNTINHCQTRCEDLWNNDKKNSYNIGNLIPLYAVLGEGNKALYYMSEFEKTGLHFNIFEGYNVSPLYESIRDEPEYKNIINRVNEKKTRILAQISEIERQWNH